MFVVPFRGYKSNFLSSFKVSTPTEGAFAGPLRPMEPKKLEVKICMLTRSPQNRILVPLRASFQNLPTGTPVIFIWESPQGDLSVVWDKELGLTNGLEIEPMFGPAAECRSVM